MKKTTLLLLSAVFFSAAVFSRNAQAFAQVSWGSAQNITGASDVSTQGSLLYAYNIGGTGVSGTTVNTVTFSPYEFPNDSSNTVNNGDIAFTENPSILTSYNNLGALSGNFSTLSSDYQTLLASGGSAGAPSQIEVRLMGLTIGQDYLVQWWSNDSSYMFGGWFGSTTASNISDSSSVTLDTNVSNTAGALGQYAIGTFTANVDEALFLLNGSGGFENLPLINAIQVRNITSAAVPEPGQIAASLLLLAGIGTYVWIKRRKAARTAAA
jgi:hypothetical protein